MMKRKMGARHIVLLALAATMLVWTGWNHRAMAAKPVPPPTFPPMPVDYLVTWLDAPAGGSSSSATGSNTAGTVAGYYANENGETRACLWTAEGVFDLNLIAPVPSGWTLITARAINEFGQIAGSAQNQVTGKICIYRYDPPTDTTDPEVTLMGDPSSSAKYSITYYRPLNNLGDVAYSATLPDGTRRSYVQAMDGTLFSAQLQWSPTSINDFRQLVAGYTRWNAATGLVESFSSGVSGVDINASGYFAGTLKTKLRTHQPIRYRTSVEVIGPAMSSGSGINSSGDVVGWDRDKGAGFIFTDTYGYVDLDTLVIAANATDLARWNSATSIVPWKITDHAVDEFGEICGYAVFSGNGSRAFLLTPIPAP
jgi:uncharacterized membrane protein